MANYIISHMYKIYNYFQMKYSMKSLKLCNIIFIHVLLIHASNIISYFQKYFIYLVFAK